MAEHMDYNEWLENEVKRLQKENEQLQKSRNNIFWFKETRKQQEENEKLKQSKREAYKWAYSLEKENAQLKDEIINHKTEIVDHRVKEYRLRKILNETTDHT